MKFDNSCNEKKYILGLITLILFLSCVTYITKIGIYSDDWAFLSVLNNLPDKSYFNLIDKFLSMAQDASFRPVKSIYQASLYYLFGLSPVYFQIVNHAVLLINVYLIFLIFKKLNLNSAVAFSISIIFALLPNYSTVKFWYAANQASICVLFYLLSLYMDIKCLNLSRFKFWTFKLLSLIFLILSVLSYEITFPLFLLNLLIIFFLPSYSSSYSQNSIDRENILKNLVLNFIALISIFIYKLSNSNIENHIDYFQNLKLVFSGILHIHLIGYGALVPYRLYQIFVINNNVYLFIQCLLISLIILYYLYSYSLRTSFHELTRSYFIKLILSGFIVLFLGYGVALSTTNVGFTLTGVNNRTAIAATIGLSIILGGLSGVMSGYIKHKKAKCSVFSIIVAFICFFGVAATNYISQFWIESYKTQIQIINELKLLKSSIKKDSTLLIDGVCPYLGPGIVFETDWDVNGMYAIYFKELKLRGSILRFDSDVGENAIFTSVYGENHNYRYADNLYVFNYKLKKIFKIQDHEAALKYLENNFDNISNCSVAYEGSGMSIF